MTDSVCTGSVVVCGEVASGLVDLPCFPEQPAVPDAGGEGEYALADACPDSLGDVSAVILEGELALGGVIDRLDPLADERGVQASDGLLEFLTGEALVSDDDLTALKQPFAACALQHRRGDLALT